ncbi:hypothetical protein C1645_837393 [Glomus cerebriforme]|uniref:Uncharacterized protein n=1 Tax=Glomus cerebriforme TaxID=658196 RepID=A0A397S6R8_9GLOM|nr:hypothetical protein C1645_837393 [Glomus cerebriforme]
MSILLKKFRFSDGFGSANSVDTGLIAGISFSIFILWIELILAFISIMFRDPENIKTKDTTFSGTATNNSTNETLNIELKSDFDPRSSDNPFSFFLKYIANI